MMNENQTEYPVFKGLQRPLEMFGFKGRYITWAVITIGSTLISIMLFATIFNFLVGFLIGLACFITGALKLFLAQRKGLYHKKVDKGLYIYARRRQI